MNKRSQIFKVLFSLPLSAGLSACAVNGDGHRQVGGGGGFDVDYEKIREVKQQLSENAEKEAGKATLSKAASIDQKTGTLVIGEVGVLQRLNANPEHKDYDKNYRMLYEQHEKNQREIYNRRPSIDLDEFKSKVTATCSLEVFYIPGVMTKRSSAIVPVELIEQIEFPSFNKSYFLGATGDLVVVKPGIDDIPIIEKVLCKKSSEGFDACKKQYSKGTFDLQTGQELDAEMKPKRDGVRISTRSYQRLE